MDIGSLNDWLTLAMKVGISSALTLYGIWFSKKQMREKINESAGIVWNNVQQELRRNNGRLPGGKTPLQLGLELFANYVPINKQTKEWIMLALKGYHEKQGHPDPVDQKKT